MLHVSNVLIVEINGVIGYCEMYSINKHENYFESMLRSLNGSVQWLKVNNNRE